MELIWFSQALKPCFKMLYKKSAVETLFAFTQNEVGGINSRADMYFCWQGSLS